LSGKKDIRTAKKHWQVVSRKSTVQLLLLSIIIIIIILKSSALVLRILSPSPIAFPVKRQIIIFPSIKAKRSSSVELQTEIGLGGLNDSLISDMWRQPAADNAFSQDVFERRDVESGCKLMNK
jgi:hypothetical protein